MSWAHEAISAIKSTQISHRNWAYALTDAFEAMWAASPGEVICITGPSRAGKSKLITELTGLVVGPDVRDDGNMPVVSVMASNCSTNGVFSTKAFAIRALTAVKHPFYGIMDSSDDWNTSVISKVERGTEGALRSALEQALKARNARYMFVDETQHALYARGGDKDCAAILDSWKCMAAEAKVILVLVGAYPLLRVLNLSPHLLGRKCQIHLPRYLPVRDDLMAFEQILEAYSEFVRLPRDIGSLRNWNELLYIGSLGVIGLLEAWLRRALSRAASRGSDVLSEKHILDTMTRRDELKVLATEIEEGEAALESSDGFAGFKDIKANVISPKKPSRKPFQKKPRRYPIDGRT